MRKPGWLSWVSIAALFLQLTLASLVLYALVGNYVGFLKPLPGAKPHTAWFDFCALIWALAAIVVGIGILRNHWWAYCMEVVVLCAPVGAILFDSRHIPEPLPTGSLGFLSRVDAAVDWSLFATFNAYLLWRAYARRRELRELQFSTERGLTDA